MGPLRLRRRRQLQRARRLHRPLPDRARRRRPGRRRPASRARTRSGRTAGRRSRAPASGPTGNKRRRHPDRHHRPVGRRLHDPARERRRSASSRTSTATTSACRTTTTPPAADNAVEFWTLMAQSRLSAPEDEAIGTSPRRPRRVGQAAARLARLRDRARRPEQARSTSARTSTTPPRHRASSSCCRTRSVTTDVGAPPPGPSSGGSGQGDDLRRHADPLGHARRRHVHAVLPGTVEHRGLRSGPVRLRLRRGQRRQRLGHGDPGHDHQGRRGQRHRRRTRRPTRRRRSTCRAYAGKTVSAALPLHDRRRGAGHRPGPRLERPVRRRDHAHHRRDDRLHATAPRAATTAGPPVGFSARRRERSPPRTTTTTSRRTARTSVVRPLPAVRARTTSASRHRPDWVEHFPYQNGLLVSYWDTSQADNNESASTRATA